MTRSLDFGVCSIDALLAGLENSLSLPVKEGLGLLSDRVGTLCEVSGLPDTAQASPVRVATCSVPERVRASKGH